MARTAIGVHTVNGGFQIMSVTEQMLFAGLGDTNQTAWCDDCGFVSEGQQHWSCAEEWHDDDKGNLCTKPLSEITLPSSIRDRLATIAERLNVPAEEIGVYSMLFTPDMAEEVDST